MSHWNNLSEKETLEQLMSLSMLYFDEVEKEIMIDKLKTLFNFVEDIKKIDTNGIEPIYNLTERYDVFRDDVPGYNLNHDKALKEVQGELKNENYFTTVK